MRSANVENVYELTALQQGMLLHTISAPDAAVYFEQVSWTVNGALDVAALSAAWQKVVDRHQILRTSFHWEGIDKPLQIVERQARAPFFEHDWRSMGSADEAARLDAFQADDRRRGFDPHEAPLARMSVIRLSEARWRVVWAFHHILLDGWSLGLVLKEILVFYDAARRNASVDLPLPAPFSGFIAWLHEQDAAEAESFWRETLKGFSAPTAIVPGQPPVAAAMSQDIGTRELVLPEATTSTLQQFARRHRITLNTVVQAAWAVLLSRYSGESDVVFGSVTAGRPVDLEGASEMVGLFINTVPMRARITPGSSVAAWLKEFQDLQVRMRQFEHTSLVDIQRVSDVPRSLPLFHSILAFENYPIDRTQAAANSDQGASDVRVFERTNYPLSIAIKPGDSLSIRLLYEVGLFDEGFIARMLGHYRQLLEEIPRDPARRVVDLPLLTEAERHRLIDWNRTEREYARDACLHELFEAHARRAPEAPALIFGGQQLSYAELDDRANRLANYLIERGLVRGGLVAVMTERSFDMIVAFLGALKAGGAYLPLDPAYPTDRLAHMVGDARPAFLLTQEALASTAAACAAAAAPPPQVLRLDTHWPEIARAGADAPRRGTTPRDASYVIYTSGSTGRPKGVVLEHGGICNVAAAQIAQFGVGPGQRVLQFSSASFDASIFDFVMALASGAALVLSRREELLGGELTRLLRDQAVTLITVPPSALAAVPVADVPALRTIAVAGEACPPQLVATWAPGRRFFNLYGPTEDTIWTTAAECQASDEAVTIGRPIGNHRVYVLDPHQQPVPVGVPGEMYIGGDGVARGYLNQPALTAERFVPDPFGNGGRLYRTGDRVRLRADGSIEFMGRLDHQVKVRGFRIELGEIDSVLSQHPSVKHAVTIVSGSASDRVVSYVVPATAGQPLSLDALRTYLRDRLPEFMIPSVFVELEQLPVNANGKVDRAALPEPTAERQLAGHYVAPRTEREATIAAIWRDVLGVASVGVRDNFFDLGGHSLLLIQVHSRIVEAFGGSLPIVTLFECPTIEALAERLGGPSPDAEPDRAARRRGRRAADTEAIAIVGMAGRFPGAPDLDAFWVNLRDGVESIRFFTDDELRAAGVDEALIRDPRYVRGRGVLDDVDQFDAEFFGYSPREAELIDPQQRLFLECASEALDRAGCNPTTFDGPIGVFAGASFNSYLLSLLADPQFFARADAMQAMTAIGTDFLPTRVSYKLNLRGPSVNVQTACSTSLVAVHQACRSLLDGECDLALAGGVSVTVPVVRGRMHQDGGILSPDGHCRAFDAAAAGTVGGNGVAVVVLKRLSEAIADGDVIRAVIRGTAVNNDGASKVGYTAPSVEGQALVIADALQAAGVEPASISYVEAHGTGTALGDPIEVAALVRAFGSGAAPRTCGIGSLKTNVGHLDAAAGVASLIKTVLALEHRQLPPSLHFDRPNSEIDFERGPFYVNATLKAWDVEQGPRRAGVSSFGIGGTNAHVVLEEAPARLESSSDRPAELLVVSARTGAALERATDDLAAFLRARTDVPLADVAHTLQSGRRRFAHRRVVAVGSPAEAVRALEARDPNRAPSAVHEGGAPSVAFMFSGQGAQHPGMGRGLYETEHIFRTEVDRCCEILAAPLGLDLRELMYPADGQRETAAARLDDTRLTQPALFVTEFAAARLWQSWGIEPAAMIGHSIGEYVAACLAGVFSLEDALHLVAARGRVMASAAAGAMAAIPLPEADVRELLGAGLDVAAVNSAHQTVVSGPHAEIDALEARLAARSVDIRRLRTSHAFHSRMLAPIVPEFGAELHKIRLRPPSIPFVSNLTGTWIRDDQATNPAYWLSHLAEPVRFADGLSALLAEPGRVLLEVGPGQTLCALARSHERRSGARDIVATLGPASAARPDVEQMAETLGRLWLAGIEPDWKAMRAGETPHRVELPAYPFARRRYWITPGAAQASAAPARRARSLDDWFYVPAWRRAPLLTTPARVGGHCLLLADDLGVGAALAAELAADGAEVTVVSAHSGPGGPVRADHTIDPDDPAAYQRIVDGLVSRGRTPDRIVHCWSLSRSPAGSPDADVTRALSLGCFSLTRLVQAMSAAGLATPVDLTVVTTGVQDVTGVEPLSPGNAAIIGPCLVVPREHAHIAARAIDVVVVGGDGAIPAAAAAVAEEIRSGSGDTLVAYRGAHRWVQTFEPAPLHADSSAAPLRRGGVYLVTGGFGGMGLEVADHLVDACGAKLVLVGRSGVPEREHWGAWLQAHAQDDPVSRTIRRLQAMEGRGGEVLPIRADVADGARMRQVVADAEARFGTIHGVIHAAGVAGGAVLQRLSPEIAQPVFAPKIGGTLALDAVFGGKPLDFFVLVSSLVSYQALAGRGDYTAAHAFLDCFARRAARTRPGVTVVNMPTWREVGMAANMLAERGIALEGQAAEAGVSTRDGIECFTRILGRRLPQVVVSPRDLAAAAEPVEEADVTAADAAAPQAPAGDAAYPRPALSTPYVAPRSPNEATLAGIWQGLLGIDRVGIHDDFFELGGDSVVSLQIIAKASQAGLKLTPAQVFERRTIAELAEVAVGVQVGAVDAGPSTGIVALTPIQHWFFDQAFDDAHHFNQSVLLEIHGTVDRSALQKAAAAVIARHEALRLRYEQRPGGWHQYVATADQSTPVRVVDLAGIGAEEQAHRLAAHAEEVQGSLDLIRGPIVRFTYFDLGAARPGRLLIVAHHLAIDAISWRTVLEDLSAALDEARNGRAIALPAATTSLERWASALSDHARSEAVEREVPYWLSIADRQSASLPVDHDRGAITTGSAQVVSVSLPPDVTRSLLTDAPKAYNTQINDLLLTALLRAFTGWSGRSNLLLDVEGHGRHPIADDIDVSRTVGWFTTLHPLWLELKDGPDLGAAIVGVKEQLRQVPQNGFGYGLLRYLHNGSVAARLARGAAPEVLFLYFGQMDQARRYGALVPAREPAGRDVSPRVRRPYLLEISTFIADGSLQANWMSSANRYRRETITALADGFRNSLTDIVEHCASAQRRYTPSDFPDAGLDQGALDSLLAKLSRSQETR